MHPCKAVPSELAGVAASKVERTVGVAICAADVGDAVGVAVAAAVVLVACRSVQGRVKRRSMWAGQATSWHRWAPPHFHFRALAGPSAPGMCQHGLALPTSPLPGLHACSPYAEELHRRSCTRPGAAPFTLPLVVAPAGAGAEDEGELPLGGDAADPGGLEAPIVKPMPGTLPAPLVPVAPARA